ncbi:hypothetical protein VTH06DRAFT_6110 [Thermothelomyces fergusii]
MSAIGHTLPQNPYRGQPYSHVGPRYVGLAQMAPAQYGTPNNMGAMPPQPYYASPHNPIIPFYQSPMSAQPPPTIPPRPDLGYYTPPFIINHTTPVGQHFYYQPGPVYSTPAPQFSGQVAPGQFGAPELQYRYSDHGSRRTQYGRIQEPNVAAPLLSPSSPQGNGAGARQSMVRGPPRKPRQSGHAIWIGNLPPQTDLMSLVHHVCKETEGLESLFLISKSNCAFANFKDEQSCVAAQRKLHDSRFMTVRLVSRLRKSTVEGPAGVTAPTGPAASAPKVACTQGAIASVGGGGDGGERAESNASPPKSAAAPSSSSASHPPVNGGPTSRKDRFFVLKSLTVEDLELSVRTKTWATQSHNEETLNTAFKTSDNVYLVFSANKSGEYFGYARMASAINEDPAAAIQFAPSAHAVTEVDLPKAIPTEPTEFAPRGRIIDDSARGTIFWEAELDDGDNDNNNDHGNKNKNNKSGSDAGQEDEGSGASVVGDTGSVRSGRDSSTPEPKAWGKPFRVEWLSTTRLPFYRTRGLRNPWNSNREVKIARDGTELEPSVGRKVIGLFNKVQSPVPNVPPVMVPGVAPAGIRIQGPLPPVGYPPLR